MWAAVKPGFEINKLQTKGSRMAEFDRWRDAGVAPTLLLSARMYTLGDVVLMASQSTSPTAESRWMVIGN